MNCANHPEIPAVAYCRTCGKPLCSACQRPAQGTIFCAEHAPSPSTSPPAPVNPAGSSPAAAFLLGLIPGVGAIYNGQYAKGLIHVVIFGLLVSLAASHNFESLEPLIGLLIAGFYLYMPFEAYHTAKRRQLGQPVDEFSSLVPMQAPTAPFPTGPVLLIALGVLFLLHNLDLLRFERILRYWPVLLIALGVHMLCARLGCRARPNKHNQEASHERH